MEHGRHTANLGRRLRGRIEKSSNKDLRVFYDHGRKGESNRVVPYYDSYDTSTTLAFVDIAIVNTRTAEVLILCEVEEEGANPKKIIGDCMNVFLADSVCIGRRRFDPSGAFLIVGVVAEEKGNASMKAKKLETRIQASSVLGSSKGIKLQIVPCPDPGALLDALEKTILKLVKAR